MVDHHSRSREIVRAYICRKKKVIVTRLWNDEEAGL
jgi:hypothetical protein